jgi:PDZ domain
MAAAKQSRLPGAVIVALTGIGIGAVATYALWSADVPKADDGRASINRLAENMRQGDPADLDAEHLAQVVNALVQTLDSEIKERNVLARQVEDLQAQLTDLQQGLGMRAMDAAQEGIILDEGQRVPAGRPGVDERLARAGFTPRQVESLRRLEAELQMQRIDLSDRAMREGWANEPRFFDEYNRLGNEGDMVRAEIGDDAYDRYLYASGRTNRVAVGSVIPTSPAEKAGLQPGDVIVSYGGERVFDGQQLVTLRSSGDRGVPVAVEVIRGGQAMQITMPRGPMGIQTAPFTSDPASPERQPGQRD